MATSAYTDIPTSNPTTAAADMLGRHNEMRAAVFTDHEGRLDTVEADLPTLVRKAQTQSASTTELEVLRLAPAATASGPFLFTLDNTVFNLTDDPILSIGYNIRADGSRVVGKEEENGFGWKIETNYDDGSTDNKIESYWQYFGPLARGTAYRPLFLQINRDTDASVMELVTNQLTFSIPNPANPVNNRPVMQLTDSTLTMSPQTAGGTIVNVRAGTGQRGFLRLGYNGVDATVELRPGANANYAVLQVGTSGGLQNINFAAIAEGIAAPALGLGTASPISPLHVKAPHTGLHISTFDQILNGLGNLAQFRDSANAIQSRVNKAGYFMTRRAAAPALGDMVDGELAVSTNANGDLVITSRVAGVLKSATVTVA